TQWYSTAEMHELTELLRDGSKNVPLDVAALQIATVEYPDLTPEPWLVLLDSHAAEFKDRITERTSGDDFVSELNTYLFDELGFGGNSESYYDAANSCLNEVLLRRSGIPITLSIVYMEVARRVGRKIRGVGLPGHFIVRYSDGDFEALLDPFHGGQVLSPEDCFTLAREATGMDLPDDPALLQPVTRRHIAIRMLNNLRAVYFQQSEPAKAVRVLDLLIEASPETAAEEYKQRGVCGAQLGRLGAAQQDLKTYLRLAPGAPDRQQVMAELERLRRLEALRA
ncbi:MAG TPA: transglutaminase-like domain-containing protein, partial [Bryobacteraceae bacterium]|nr:transglutaminase-like domain-containing protein [Bryobacteraceae bacterium]